MKTLSMTGVSQGPARLRAWSGLGKVAAGRVAALRSPHGRGLADGGGFRSLAPFSDLLLF